MIKQNDKRCLPDIQRIGCFVRSCGAIAELKAGKELVAEQINLLWLWAKRTGCVDSHNLVKRSAPIISKTYEMLGCKGQFYEVGTFQKGKTTYYASVGESLRKAEKWYIQKIGTKGDIGTHFRVVKADGEVLFDPYEPAIKPEKIFYTIIYAFKEF